MLDVRRLHLLRALRIHGTVTATAAALHLSGPAVSQQLAVLEREAGLPLLEKHGRTVRLTAAGSLLAEHAEVILGHLATAEADLQALRGSGRGPVHVAIFPSAARVLLPRLWRALRQHPGQPDLRATECEPGPAADALRRGSADIAVVHAYSLLPRDLPNGCESRHLMEEPVLLALPRAIAARRGLVPGQSADLARFAGEDWLMPHAGGACRELTMRACGAAGFVPHPIAVASDFSVLTALVAAEVGITLVPRMTLPADIDAISLHPLTQPLSRTVSVLTRIGEARQPHLDLALDGLRSAAVSYAGNPPWPDPGVQESVARSRVG